jgi:hypothetical protein
MWDFDIGRTLAILARTWPFIVVRLLVYFSISVAYVAATGTGAGIGFGVGHIFGGAEGPAAVAFWGGAVGFALVSVVLYWLREYILYVVKAGHIAVMVRLIDGQPVPDGKGQVAVDMDTSLRAAWEELGSDDAILERRVAFACEISAIVARGLDGECRVFPLAMNEHRDGILRRSVAPAPVDPAVARAAEAAAVALAEALELVGLLAVEFFVTEDGQVLVNEIAPRPHNSGHWTQDGCATSQFEQFVRAVVGLPLGPVDALFETEMLNLIGDDANDWPTLIADPTAKLHLYGKAEARPGRKMGHVNRRLRPWPSDRPA